MTPPERWQVPVTERVAARVLSLPTGSAVRIEDVQRVCALIRFAADHAAGIHDRMAAASIASAGGPPVETVHSVPRP